MNIWVAVIFVYYILATVLPINTIIGKIYPLFGALLIFMALAIFVGIIYYSMPIPELNIASFKTCIQIPMHFQFFQCFCNCCMWSDIDFMQRNRL